jgi:DNA polymerase III delta subunit
MVENRNNDTIVIFVSPKMDKRSKIAKDILKYATHKTFDTDMRAKKRLPEVERDVAEAS